MITVLQVMGIENKYLLKHAVKYFALVSFTCCNYHS